jgi:UV DNA damage endonuclease
MRMSSEMFPFASHATHGYDLSYCQEELKAVGDLAKKYGHRLTTYPGPLTQLASPKENVVEASIKELECWCFQFHLGLHCHTEPSRSCRNDGQNGVGPRFSHGYSYGCKWPYDDKFFSLNIWFHQGVYGDKAATLARFKDNYQKKLSGAVKRRLVLENDEVD